MEHLSASAVAGLTSFVTAGVVGGSRRRCDCDFGGELIPDAAVV